MKYGLNERDIDCILKAVQEFTEVERVIIFGSRAIGNYKKGSDIDIAIKGENISKETITRLSGILNDELPLPFFFDVVDYKTISNNELKKHIDDNGKIMFERL